MFKPEVLVPMKTVNRDYAPRYDWIDDSPGADD